MANTRDINVEKEFKGLKFSMCILPIDDGYGGIDFEFSISGDILPMVEIGMIEHYAEGGELYLNDYEDVCGSKIYVPLTYGRVCQGEDDEEPTYIEVFECGVDEGIYILEEDRYKVLAYDKNEIVNILYSMANECKQIYESAKMDEISESREYGADTIKCCGNCLENRIEESDGYMHCELFGIPTDLFYSACEYYKGCTDSDDVIKEIIKVESFVF